MSEKQIWKYTLIDGDGSYQTNHDIPEDAEFRHIAMQYNCLCVWFEVDPSAPKENRRFLTVGTGHQFNDGGGLLRYLGTVMTNNDAFVFHTYEATMLDRAKDGE